MTQKLLFQYFGGKRYLVNDIFQCISPLYINKKIDSFVDVFGGSGKVLLNIPTDWRILKTINDVDKRIYITFNVLQDQEQRNELLERYDWTLQSREMFNQINNFNDEDWNNMSNLDIAYNFLYNLSCSYCGAFKSYGYAKIFKSSKPIISLQNNINNNFQYLKDWNIENLDYLKVIKKYDTPSTIFYLDPPYLKSGKTYKYKFTIDDFKNLKNQLDNIKGYYLMNESEVDFENIIKIFGPPNFTKSFINNFGRYNKKIKTYRKEGFWYNF